SPFLLVDWHGGHHLPPLLRQCSEGPREQRPEQNGQRRRKRKNRHSLRFLFEFRRRTALSIPTCRNVRLIVLLLPPSPRPIVAPRPKTARTRLFPQAPVRTRARTD